MVLLHGGIPQGAERIAACWTNACGAIPIAIRPDWNRHAKAAPFRRNDQMLSVMPYGVIAFPGGGIAVTLRDGPQGRFSGLADHRGRRVSAACLAVRRASARCL